MAVVLVTGCSSGFGLLSVVELTRRGHTVVATMRDPTRDSALRQALEAGGRPEAVTVEQLDITDDASVQTAVDRALARHGQIDALVNNAGVAVGGAIEDVDLDEMLTVLATNVIGTVRVTKAVLPSMRAAGRGHVVNVTSLAAFVAPPFMGVYAASKHALDAVGEALAAEVAPFGISVTNVAPGAYDTPMVGDVEHALETIDLSSPYGERARTAMTRHLASMRENDDPGMVARAVAYAIEADPPPGRVVVPATSAFIVEARGTTPPEQMRQLIAQSYGVDVPGRP